MDNYEERFDEWREKGRRLGLVVPKTTWGYVLQDCDGIVIDEREQLSRSWTRNAYNALILQLGGGVTQNTTFGIGKMSSKDTAGSIVPVGTNIGLISNVGGDGSPSYSNETVYGYYGGANIATYGIVVGSSNAAENFSDYKLTTPILSGSASGTLVYQASTITEAWNGGALEYTSTFKRILNNNSGYSVNIGEVGIYARGSYNTAMYIRDVISPVIEVIDAAQLDIFYNITLAYPE